MRQLLKGPVGPVPNVVPRAESAPSTGGQRSLALDIPSGSTAPDLQLTGKNEHGAERVLLCPTISTVIISFLNRGAKWRVSRGPVVLVLHDSNIESPIYVSLFKDTQRPRTTPYVYIQSYRYFRAIY